MRRAPSFSSRVKHSCRLLKRVCSRLAEVEIGEQAPQEDAGRAQPRLLDPAQPTHELRQPAPRNAVGQQEIDVFLLNDAIDQGAGSHLKCHSAAIKCAPGYCGTARHNVADHIIGYVLGACALVFLLRKARVRLQLSRAKHRSLAGHARMARRFAGLVPYYEYGEERVFRADGAPRRDRRRAARRLHAARRRRSQRGAPKNAALTAAVIDAISDLQFTSRYRVPFQFSRFVREHFEGRRLRGIDLRVSPSPISTATASTI